MYYNYLWFLLNSLFKYLATSWTKILFWRIRTKIRGRKRFVSDLFQPILVKCTKKSAGDVHNFRWKDLPGLVSINYLSHLCVFFQNGIQNFPGIQAWRLMFFGRSFIRDVELPIRNSWTLCIQSHSRIHWTWYVSKSYM